MEELVFFQPPSPLRTVLVSNLPSSIEQQGLEELVNGFGPIFQIQLVNEETQHDFSHLKPDTSSQESSTPPASSDELKNSPSSTWRKYAYIKFFSMESAKKAQLHLNDRPFRNTILRAYVCSYAMTHTSNYGLSMQNIVTLANFYIGFNKWNCCILRLHEVKFDRAVMEVRTPLDGYTAASATANQPCPRFHQRRGVLCEMEVKVLSAHFPFCVKGTGYGYHSDHQKYIGGTWERAKKMAVTNAYRRAFSKIVIVKLNSKKMLAIPKGLPPNHLARYISLSTSNSSSTSASSFSSSSSPSSSAALPPPNESDLESSLLSDHFVNDSANNNEHKSSAKNGERTQQTAEPRYVSPYNTEYFRRRNMNENSFDLNELDVNGLVDEMLFRHQM